jgi:hypothetical protein
MRLNSRMSRLGADSQDSACNSCEDLCVGVVLVVAVAEERHPERVVGEQREESGDARSTAGVRDELRKDVSMPSASGRVHARGGHGASADPTQSRM